MQQHGETIMKTTIKEPTCTRTKIEPKTGALSTKRLATLLHLGTKPVVPKLIIAGTSRLAYREEQNAANELEAELRKSSARTYASTLPLR